MIALFSEGLLALLVGCFVVYVALEVRSVRTSARQEDEQGAPVCCQCCQIDTPSGKQALDLQMLLNDESPARLAEGCLPTVSVLLPVYNEKHVVEKLIDAACALQYPVDRLDILVLDDSTDETRELAAARVALYRERGIPIRHARRETRIGYKAGNLNFGLTLATGAFIAIFDADCLPPFDFLLKTMPCFQNPQVGFLQTGVGYANKDASFLTRFQAMEAGHKETVTLGLSKDGFMASLTGSSCVWRRACIEDIGGISDETITEDVDMGYRAQLHTWRYLFLRDVVSLAELPETMGAFRVQRQRWARGLVHNALRHVRQVFATPMALMPRLQALSLMFSALLLAAFYALLLLALPLAFMTASMGAFFNIYCTLFLLASAVWAWTNVAGGEKHPLQSTTIWNQVWRTLGYVMMFFPLSLYYFSAAVQVIAGISGEFHRTPKGCKHHTVTYPPVNTLLIALEIASFAYALLTLGVSLARGNGWVALYGALAASGFGLVLLLTWLDGRRANAHSPRHVLITGATGAIGGALALEYAAPGRMLTLLGRCDKRLEELAAQCSSRGALVTIHKIDLRDRENLMACVRGLCEANTPDLCIASAGLNTNIGAHGQGERLQDVEALVEVNLLAVMTLIHGLLPFMRRQGRGQIALMSSLAGYFGLPTVPSYCATKAALKAYGESLRGWLGLEGIRVNVIMPGYVASPMCAAMPGPKPFLWTPEKAARHIRRGLERDAARIAFPCLLHMATWWLAVLPPRLSTALVRLFGYGR